MELIFEWDTNKARKNSRKHKVSFEEAKTVFNDPFTVTYSDPEHSNSEERYITIGVSAIARLLLVVHTGREEETIRIINCRKAIPAERRFYEQGEN
jgi:uncharacterized protein